MNFKLRAPIIYMTKISADVFQFSSTETKLWRICGTALWKNASNRFGRGEGLSSVHLWFCVFYKRRRRHCFDTSSFHISRRNESLKLVTFTSIPSISITHADCEITLLFTKLPAIKMVVQKLHHHGTTWINFLIVRPCKWTSGHSLTDGYLIIRRHQAWITNSTLSSITTCVITI